MPRDSNNWCPEIYNGLFISRRNNDQILIAPCCQARPQVAQVSTFDFSTNEYLTQLRQEFANNQQPSACNRCWDSESRGEKSRRQSAIEFYNSTPNYTAKLQGLDFSTTWACNCACIMCGPWNSSLWASELDVDNKLLGKTQLRQNPILRRLKLDKLKKVHFNGGEPLLTDDHLTVLKSTELDTLFASYNTNGTIYPNKQTIDIWGQMPLVKLFFSIDAIGPAHDYIRWPAKWTQVEDNLKRMRDMLPSNVMFGFNVTVGVYNVFELPAMVEWFNTNLGHNREGDPSDFNCQIAYNYDPAALDTNAKQQALALIKNHTRLQGIYNYLSGCGHKNIAWQSQLDQIDQRRNTNWRASLQIGKIT